MTGIGDLSALAARYEILVIGAGPAGMRAAVIASRHGASVLLVDENSGVGGQIYRAITTTPVRDKAILGADYWHGAALAEELAAADATILTGATVWSISRPGPDAEIEVGISRQGAARIIVARHIILASGAVERPFPVPGWTLPGVLTAGAAQIALKSSGLVPQGKVVLAGCGPLLVLLASQLRAAGAEIIAVLDTTPRGNWREAILALPDFLASPYLGKGLALLRDARRGLRITGGVTALRIEGPDRARRVHATVGGKPVQIDCDLVLLHHGVIPSNGIANAIGCALRFDPVQHCFVPERDDWFTSSLAHVSIPGDGGGIGGAEAAALQGEIAGLAALTRLGHLTPAGRDQAAAAPRAQLVRALRGRRFLDLLYRPARPFLAPEDDATIVCRCEEVTAGQIRDTVRSLDVPGPNQLKAFLRCGMGPCQGRMCAPTVSELMSELRGVPIAEIGTYRLRPPFKPITVAEIAALPQTEAAVAAVIR